MTDADRPNELAIARAASLLHAATIDRFKEWYARREATARTKLVDEIAGWHEAEARRYEEMGHRFARKQEWHSFSADVIRSTWGVGGGR